MEIVKDDKLAFLDVQLERKGTSLHTLVYRKPTHTDRYLKFRSNHHPRTKTGVISCLKERAINVCSEDNLDDELRRLHLVFQANCFPLQKYT